MSLLFSWAGAKLLVLGVPAALMAKIVANSLAVRVKAKMRAGKPDSSLPDNVIKGRSLL